MENLKKALELLGASQSEITDLISETATEESVKSIIEGLKSNQKELIKNDPEFISSIVKPVEGRLKSVYENTIKKKLQLSNEEIKEMKFEEMLDFGVSKLTKTPAKEAQAIQEENLQLKSKVAEYEAQLPEIENKYKNKFEESVNNFKIKQDLHSYLDKLNRDKDGVEGKGLLIGKPSSLIKFVESHLHENYNVKHEDNGISVLTKDDMKIYNKEKTAFVGYDEIVNSYLDEGGFLKKSNASTEADPNKNKRVITDSDKQESPGVKAARANLERLNAEKENK
jgi:hypothetical protein